MFDHYADDFKTENLRLLPQIEKEDKNLDFKALSTEQRLVLLCDNKKRRKRARAQEFLQKLWIFYKQAL